MNGLKPKKVSSILDKTLKRLLNLKKQSTLYVLAVVQRLLQTGLREANGVQGPVLIEPTSEDLGKRSVYNLTVEGEHEYYANGILVSNCHSTIYMRIALSKLVGRGFGMGYAEPNLTSETKTADYVDRQGRLVFDLSEQIMEAMDE